MYILQIISYVTIFKKNMASMMRLLKFRKGREKKKQTNTSFVENECQCGCGCTDKHLKKLTNWIQEENLSFVQITTLITALSPVIPNLRLRLKSYFFESILEERLFILSEIIATEGVYLTKDPNAFLVSYNSAIWKIARECDAFPIFEPPHMSLYKEQEYVMIFLSQEYFIEKACYLLKRLFEHHKANIINIIINEDMVNDNCCVPSLEEMRKMTQEKSGRTVVAKAIEIFMAALNKNEKHFENIVSSSNTNENLLKFCISTIQTTLEDEYAYTTSPALASLSPRDLEFISKNHINISLPPPPELNQEQINQIEEQIEELMQNLPPPPPPPPTHNLS